MFFSSVTNCTCMLPLLFVYIFLCFLSLKNPVPSQNNPVNCTPPKFSTKFLLLEFSCAQCAKLNIIPLITIPQPLISSFAHQKVHAHLIAWSYLCPCAYPPLLCAHLLLLSQCNLPLLQKARRFCLTLSELSMQSVTLLQSEGLCFSLDSRLYSAIHLVTATFVQP